MTTWVLESDVFPDSHQNLRGAVVSAGHRLVDWSDLWWQDGFPASVGIGPTVFHGSLGNAAQIDEKLAWKPGAFCEVSRFHCSAWYESASPWLLHSKWRLLPANEFVRSARAVCADLGCADKVFVRPDSPLKPFSGRVLEIASISLAALDYGFYFEDESLPIIVAPVRRIGCERRFVVVRSRIVAGSAYDAATRTAKPESPDSRASTFAAEVAANLPAAADVYILDVCESDDAMRLVELNPFGGADLYACNAASVVRAVSELATP